MGMVSASNRSRRQEERAGYRSPTDALVALAQLLVAGVDSSRMVREAARATAMTLGADLCEVLRLEAGGEHLSRVASSDENATCDEPSTVPRGVSSIVGYALLCGAPIFSPDLCDERRFGTAGMPRWKGPVSAVAASVPGRGDAFGVLVAYAARIGSFGPHHALSISRTASLLGGALELLDEHEKLRRRAEEAKHHSVVVRETCERAPEHKDYKLTDRQLARIIHERLRKLAKERAISPVRDAPRPNAAAPSSPTP